MWTRHFSGGINVTSPKTQYLVKGTDAKVWCRMEQTSSQKRVTWYHQGWVRIRTGRAYLFSGRWLLSNPFGVCVCVCVCVCGCFFSCSCFLHCFYSWAILLWENDCLSVYLCMNTAFPWKSRVPELQIGIIIIIHGCDFLVRFQDLCLLWKQRKWCWSAFWMWSCTFLDSNYNPVPAMIIYIYIQYCSGFCVSFSFFFFKQGQTSTAYQLWLLMARNMYKVTQRFLFCGEPAALYRELSGRTPGERRPLMRDHPWWETTPF